MARPLKSNLVGITIECPYCGLSTTIDRNHLSWYSHTTPCEMCGEHGITQVTLDIDSTKCPACKKKFDDVIEIESW